MYEKGATTILSSLRSQAALAGDSEGMSYSPLRRGRQTLRETLERNLATQKLALMATPDDHPRKQANIERIAKFEAQIAAMAPKRQYVRRPVDGKPAVPYERDIQKACLQLLRAHPKVACVWRQNSGTFAEQNRDGSQRYISAHTMPGLPDIVGFLHGGTAIFFEVKRPGGKATPMQQAFIDRANAAGAIAAVITDPQQVIDILK